jgi:hypothetical protein
VPAATLLESPVHQRGVVAFALPALRRVTWRAVLVPQFIAVLFALTPWLEQWHHPGQSRLLEGVLRQAPTALLVMLAAFAGDEAVRRGCGVWRAFVIALLGASLTNVLVQLLVSYGLGIRVSERGLLNVLYDFLLVGGLWGTVLMVYLNRQSARRLLARLRAGELERAETERRLIASRLAAAESQIDPAAVLRQLSEVRTLYAGGRPEAEERFEALITELRETVTRAAAAQAHDASP